MVFLVVPAKAGTQRLSAITSGTRHWVPAFAGTTTTRSRRAIRLARAVALRPPKRGRTIRRREDSTWSSDATPRTFDQAAWGAALAQQVTAAAVAATRETTVRIKPDGLGPIDVRVSVASGHVDVRFAIEHPVTVNMVRDALPDLQRMLAQSGLSLGDAEVAQQNAGNRGQAARGDASGFKASDEEPAAAVRAASGTRPRARVGLLDDFV